MRYLMRDAAKSELDSIATEAGLVAVHARLLAEMERTIAPHIERSPLFSVVVADTAVAENYTDPARCLAWLTASHRSWLRSNAEFNRRAERLIFFRHILLPYPSVLRNWQKKQLLIDIILLHVHLHLWHGVICGVVFFDPRSAVLANVIEDLNFIAIPSHHVFLDTPAFYRGESVQTTLLAAQQADQRLASINRLLVGNGRGVPIWLHYDEATFSRKRLEGWRWEALRAFFRQLYGPRLVCIGCRHEIGRYELDHIAPISSGYPQTIVNFRPLCRACNRKKGALIGEDPFQTRILLPPEIRTRELDDIQRLPPPWLGTLDSSSLTPRTLVRRAALDR
jgi:5-methylcytosine-specific restriction endonuclease McrA